MHVKLVGRSLTLEAMLSGTLKLDKPQYET